MKIFLKTKTYTIVGIALICAIMQFVYPDWQTELRAQQYCDPPSNVWIDLVGASGFLDYTITDTSIVDSKFKADLVLENYLRFWMEIVAIYDYPNSLSHDVFNGWSGNFLPPCQTGISEGLGCKSPGESFWIAEFCSKDSIDVDILHTKEAFSLTLANIVIGQFADIAPLTIINIKEDLMIIPLFAEAVECFSEKFRNRIPCAGKNIFKLARDKEQRLQFAAVLAKYGIDVGADILFSKLTIASFSTYQVAADYIAFITQATLNGTYPYLYLEIIGE